VYWRNADAHLSFFRARNNRITPNDYLSHRDLLPTLITHRSTIIIDVTLAPDVNRDATANVTRLKRLPRVKRISSLLAYMQRKQRA